jgi:hypothetical protein
MLFFTAKYHCICSKNKHLEKEETIYTLRLESLLVMYINNLDLGYSGKNGDGEEREKIQMTVENIKKPNLLAPE